VTQTLTIIKPDDWHLHLRDGDTLQRVVGHTAARFGRAVVMPNLTPPVTTAMAAQAYRQRILEALPDDTTFNPLMTMYLTPSMSPQDIVEASKAEHVIGVKWYPAGATTNSSLGVHNINECTETLEAMAEYNVPLLVHGEVTDAAVDTFDREAVFVETILDPLLHQLPTLRVVLEHITTSQGADYVSSQGANVAGTLTPQHLLLNRTSLFQGGLRPHNFCLPILKRESHRVRLMEAATSGDASFFLGTDSAPHAQSAKESDCGCAGIFSAHAGIELYAEAFEDAGSLDRLEGFASKHGPAFYGLPLNTDTITLARESWQVPESYSLGQERLIPFRAGHSMRWSML